MTQLIQRIAHAAHGLFGHDATVATDCTRLHDELRHCTAMLPRCLLAPAGNRSPEYLNHETLLGKELPHASRLRDGTVLMASPGIIEAHRFAHACVEHQISRVVDLRSAKEKQHAHASPLDGGKASFVKDHEIACFGRSGRERPLKGAGPQSREDHVRSIEVSLKPGRHHPAAGGHAPREVSRPLEWVRVHVGSGKAIAPQRLLDISLHLAHTASGGRTAFQCADGLHTGATFAAANALMQTHLRARLSPKELNEAVLDECLSIRRDRGPELFRPEDLASLMAFGRLMLEADRRGELREVRQGAALARETPPPATLPPATLPPATLPPVSLPTVTVSPVVPVSARPRTETSLTGTPPAASPPPRALPQEGAARMPGGERRHITFANETSVRYVVDQESGDRVTQLATDFQRTVLEGNLTVPRRIGREINGEAEAFPDEPGHDSRWRKHRNPTHR